MSAPLAEATSSASPATNAICAPSGDHAASMPGTLPTCRSSAVRTVVVPPVSTSSSPLPGRKPRGRPSPITSASGPRTAGVKRTCDAASAGDCRSNASVVPAGDHHGLTSRGGAGTLALLPTGAATRHSTAIVIHLRRRPHGWNLHRDHDLALRVALAHVAERVGGLAELVAPVDHRRDLAVVEQRPQDLQVLRVELRDEEARRPLTGQGR